MPDTVDTGLHALLDDLTAEQQSLLDVLRGLSEDDWLRPTPARGWDVRDTVAHLADTDEMAIATATGAPGSLNERAEHSASGEDVTFRGVLRGRRQTGRRGVRVVRDVDCGAARDVPRDRPGRTGAVGHRDAAAVARERPA